MCPEYLNNKDANHYEAAYDVYSIGMVMVELILGRLIGDCDSSSANHASEFLDMLLRNSSLECEEGNQIMTCCEWLKEHADPSIVWDAECLDRVCKAAIGCLRPITPTGGRMTMEELVNTTREIIQLDFVIKIRNVMRC